MRGLVAKIPLLVQWNVSVTKKERLCGQTVRRAHSRMLAGTQTRGCFLRVEATLTLATHASDHFVRQWTPAAIQERAQYNGRLDGRSTRQQVSARSLPKPILKQAVAAFQIGKTANQTTRAISTKIASNWNLDEHVVGMIVHATLNLSAFASTTRTTMLLPRQPRRLCRQRQQQKQQQQGLKQLQSLSRHAKNGVPDTLLDGLPSARGGLAAAALALNASPQLLPALQARTVKV